MASASTATTVTVPTITITTGAESLAGFAAVFGGTTARAAIISAAATAGVVGIVVARAPQLLAPRAKAIIDRYTRPRPAPARTIHAMILRCCRYCGAPNVISHLLRQPILSESSGIARDAQGRGRKGPTRRTSHSHIPARDENRQKAEALTSAHGLRLILTVHGQPASPPPRLTDPLPTLPPLARRDRGSHRRHPLHSRDTVSGMSRKRGITRDRRDDTVGSRCRYFIVVLISELPMFRNFPAWLSCRRPRYDTGTGVGIDRRVWGSGLQGCPKWPKSPKSFYPDRSPGIEIRSGKNQ